MDLDADITRIKKRLMDMEARMVSGAPGALPTQPGQELSGMFRDINRSLAMLTQRTQANEGMVTALSASISTLADQVASLQQSPALMRPVLGIEVPRAPQQMAPPEPSIEAAPPAASEALPPDEAPADEAQAQSDGAVG